MTKVLVIDDDPSILEFVSTVLSADHDVSTAGNGEEGLALCRNQEFGLVITDIYMPFMDGLELIRELNKISDAKIITITAEHRESAVSYLRLAEDMGAAATLGKPFTAGELTDTVKTVLEG